MILTFSLALIWGWTVWHRQSRPAASLIIETEVPRTNSGLMEEPGAAAVRKPFQEIAPH